MLLADGVAGDVGPVEERHGVLFDVDRRPGAVVGLPQAGGAARADVDRSDQEAGESARRGRPLPRLRAVDGTYRCQPAAADRPARSCLTRVEL